jgi:2-haloacid dehalogenase
MVEKSSPGRRPAVVALAARGFSLHLLSEMKMYRGVLLDADNTLFDYDRAEAEALEETFADAVPGVPRARAAEAYRDINARYWKLFEQGSITAAGLQTGRWADLFQELGHSGDPSAAAAMYVASLSTKTHFLPGASELIRELASRVRLCLVTNGLSRVQRGRLAHSGIAGHFSAVLISEELGFAKPDPRFFLAAAIALDIPARQLLCVGDSPTADIAGARAAGIDACWFSPSGAPWPGPGEPPPYVVHALSDVLLLVARSDR